MSDSYEIDVDIVLNSPSKTALDKLRKQIGGSITIDGGGGANSTLDRLMNVDVGVSKKMLTKITVGIGILTGILGTLKKVPSILQASLKIMSIGFLLILKPVADLIGMLLMPIAKAMIKLSKFVNEFSLGAGIGGIIGMLLLSAIAIALLSGTTIGIIAAGAIVLAVAFVGLILGTIVGAIVGYTWGKLVDLEKGIISWILETLDSWFGLPTEGFWGKIIGIIESWIGNTDDMRSFWMVIADTITGNNMFGGVKKEKSFMTHVAAGFGPIGMLMELMYRKSATGGVFNSPTPAIIGEAGPEVVIPLSQMDNMGGGVNINVNGIFEESRLRDIMRVVAEDVLNRHKQISGSVF